MTMLEKILRLIDETGTTQGAVESAAGLPAGRISRWSKGTGEPKASQVVRLAKCLHVDVRYLLDDSLDRPIPDLNDVESRIIWLSRQIGYDTAIRRLTVAPEVKFEGPSYAEIREAERKRGGKGGGRNSGA
jgi:transcriptional regulator with XRE-family HTH domain